MLCEVGASQVNQRWVLGMTAGVLCVEVGDGRSEPRGCVLHLRALEGVCSRDLWFGTEQRLLELSQSGGMELAWEKQGNIGQ